MTRAKEKSGRLEDLLPHQVLSMFEESLKSAPDSEATRTLRSEVRRRMRVEAALALLFRDLSTHRRR